jgi:parvulin-like peptidyl-prolyl isomerase
MGDRKPLNAGILPPPIEAAARKMKPGEVSDLFQFGSNYTLFRLNSYSPAHKLSFAESQQELRTELQKTRMNELRGALNKRLQKSSRVEIL